MLYDTLIKHAGHAIEIMKTRAYECDFAEITCADCDSSLLLYINEDIDAQSEV